MNSRRSWQETVLPADSTVVDAIQNLNRTGLRIVMIADGEGRLAGTVSDGDIRRGLLNGAGMDSPIEGIMHRNATVVPPSLNPGLVRQIMLTNRIQQIPVVDERGCPVGLHVWDELESPTPRPNPAVIMAGGLGTRLRPITLEKPKALVEVRGKPMLQHIIERLSRDGFTNIVISVNYLGEMIEQYFGDGENFGLNITYLHETSPMGTAGSLSLLESVPELPILVTNCDVLTEITYSDLIDFHNRHQPAATMAIRSHEWQNPYGVVRTDGIDIIELEEKPVVFNYINAGIYVLSPIAVEAVRKDESCDMPQLFKSLAEQKLRTIAFPIHEGWADLGSSSDLSAAQEDTASK